MTVRKNRYYNDPAISATFDNLSDMFKAPSGTDVRGYVEARATRDKAGRLSEMFDYSKRSDYDQTTADRMGVALGLHNPSQSYYAVDANNRASVTNNQADNRRAYGVAALNERGQMDRALLNPVGTGQTRFVPPSIAQFYSVPETQVGTIEAKPGERINTPDGRVFEGATKPMSSDEVRGSWMQDARKNGQISDTDLKATIMGATPIESVQTPNGPRYAYRSDAVGQRPLPDASKQSELATLQGEREGIRNTNPQDPRIAEYNNRISALGRGQQQDEYSKGIDKSLVEFGESIFKGAQAAQGNMATVNEIQQMLDRVGNDQGKFASARTEIRRGLNALGIQAGDTSPAEVVNALSNKLALQLRDPSSGAGMPGAMSDSDREFLRSMTVNLDNSPGANRTVGDAFRRVYQRSIDIERMRRDYVKQNGRLDEGFRASVSDFADRNPLFPGSRETQGGGGQERQPVRVSSVEEARKLPSGTPLILPDGSSGWVP